MAVNSVVIVVMLYHWRGFLMCIPVFNLMLLFKNNLLTVFVLNAHSDIIAVFDMYKMFVEALFKKRYFK